MLGAGGRASLIPGSSPPLRQSDAVSPQHDRGRILQDNEYLPMIRAPSSLAKTRQRGGGNDKGETFGLQNTIRLGDKLSKTKCFFIFSTEHEKPS